MYCVIGEMIIVEINPRLKKLRGGQEDRKWRGFQEDRMGRGFKGI